MSDAQRKRTLAEWVVKTKKQVVKLYAVVKWSRDAAVVQKAMVSTRETRKVWLILNTTPERYSVPYGPEPPVRRSDSRSKICKGKP